MSIVLIPLLNVIKIILNLYVWVLLASVTLSWLFFFKVVNPYNSFVLTLNRILQKVTEPLLQPLRRILPNLGGIDLSPMLLILGVIFLSDVLSRIQIALLGG